MYTKSILELLKKAERPAKIILSLLIAGYDYRAAKRKFLYPTLPEKSSLNHDTSLNLRREKHKFYSLLSQLRKQGFVEKRHKNNETYWKITSLGERRLEKLKNVFSFPKLVHKQERDSGINIVVFDVPEKKKTTRDWLRHTLMNLNFVMLQESVWLGRNKLPEEFLKSLVNLGIFDYVHIFKITKTGTIKKFNL